MPRPQPRREEARRREPVAPVDAPTTEEVEPPDIAALESGKSPRRKASGPGERLRVAEDRRSTSAPEPTDPDPQPG